MADRITTEGDIKIQKDTLKIWYTGLANLYKEVNRELNATIKKDATDADTIATSDGVLLTDANYDITTKLDNIINAINELHLDDPAAAGNNPLVLYAYADWSDPVKKTDINQNEPTEHVRFKMQDTLDKLKNICNNIKRSDVTYPDTYNSKTNITNYDKISACSVRHGNATMSYTEESYTGHTDPNNSKTTKNTTTSNSKSAATTYDKTKNTGWWNSNVCTNEAVNYNCSQYGGSGGNITNSKYYTNSNCHTTQYTYKLNTNNNTYTQTTHSQGYSQSTSDSTTYNSNTSNSTKPYTGYTETKHSNRCDYENIEAKKEISYTKKSEVLNNTVKNTTVSLEYSVRKDVLDSSGNPEIVTCTNINCTKYIER